MFASLQLLMMTSAWFARRCTLFFFYISLLCDLSIASPTPPKNGTCRKTKVVILGAGMTGIAAAQALHNASVTDFIIVDVNDYIGGRVKHTSFGKNASSGEPYVVELGYVF